MNCNCAQFQPIELDRQSIKRRIKESPTIRKQLIQIAENAELRLYLFRCPVCGQLWQSGHEWNFADREYLFQVPVIEVADWQHEPYQQPAAMMIYSAVMRDFWARANFEPSDSFCRSDGCKEQAIRFSIFCRKHHIESLQKLGNLPKNPVGRLFPPYYVDRPLSQIPVAILAGGLATRLRPITEKIPKSLVPVAGKPFLAHQLELLRSRGIRRAVLCVGYLGEMIQCDFGDGQKYGIRLEYSFDGDKLLGTGGAIKRALQLLSEEFFVLYGDSYLPVDYAPIAELFHQSGKLGCMTVYRNEGKYDTSNVVFADGEINVYDKKAKLPEMRHIDYGLSLFKASAFDSYPADQPFDLAEVMGKLVREKQLAGYEVPERFYEMGSPAGLAELEALLGKRAD